MNPEVGERLNTCRFCGGQAGWTPRESDHGNGAADDYTGYVECDRCGVRCYFNDFQEALKKWNLKGDS